MVTNTVEREIRPVAVIRKAVPNSVEPKAWPTDLLEQMVSGKVNSSSLAPLPPWVCHYAKFSALTA